MKLNTEFTTVLQTTFWDQKILTGFGIINLQRKSNREILLVHIVEERIEDIVSTTNRIDEGNCLFLTIILVDKILCSIRSSVAVMAVSLIILNPVCNFSRSSNAPNVTFIYYYRYYTLMILKNNVIVSTWKEKHMPLTYTGTNLCNSFVSYFERSHKFLWY